MRQDDARTRAKALVAKMTLAEKASQMRHQAAAVPRLGIPEYNWWSEALHGVARAGRATVFPQSIGLAATFDDKLVEKVFSATAHEARARHHASAKLGYRRIYAGLTFWTPNINIFRDPRWGRGQETYGEDPLLTSRMGCAVVRGLQGKHPRYLEAAACAKHFAVHSGPEELRHGFDARVSGRDLSETYLPAFRALVREAKVEAVMGAYNRTNGEPCCASPTLMRILRHEWGFDGHFVSDCGAIDDFHEHHKVTRDGVESAALAVRAGCDLNCGSTYNAILAALEAGKLTEADIDACVTRLMVTRIRLGMMDDPRKVPYTKIKTSVVDSPAHRGIALAAARESIVLLKNTGVLPLPASSKSIFVTGPAANDPDVLLGNYNGHSRRAVTLLEGIVAAADPACVISFVPGCAYAAEQTGGFGQAWHHIYEQKPDVIVACMGISAAIEGEEGAAALSDAGGDRSDIGLPGAQERWIRELSKTGKPIVLVLTGGSPIAAPSAVEMCDGVLAVFYPGEEGGTALGEVLFGTYNPAGRLPFTVPSSLSQLPPFEDYSMKGRTYRFMTDEPLFPFGFGLSYTTFAYGKLALSRTSIPPSGRVTVTAVVKNTGKRAGDEVAQCYLRDVAASVPVPVRKLVGFRRVHLLPGKAATVRFGLGPQELACYADDGTPRVEPGDFEITVGGGQPGAEARGGAPCASARFSVA